MRQVQAGKILRIHVSESDRCGGKPLYEAIVAKCRELKIAGATVIAGLEGFGATAEMQKAHLLHSNRPILIVVVDTAANVDRLVPVVGEMMDTGLMAVSDVETIRVETGTQG
jgi:PII-like signaling protein